MAEITREEHDRARQRMREARRAGYAVAAHYDPERARVVVTLHTGVEVAFPPDLAQELAGAAPEDLAEIEITPSGLGLHWPRIDGNVYIPSLMQGEFGNRRWMAALLGAAGGSSRSPAKAAAARANGRRGGRPRKATRG